MNILNPLYRVGFIRSWRRPVRARRHRVRTGSRCPPAPGHSVSDTQYPLYSVGCIRSPSNWTDSASLSHKMESSEPPPLGRDPTGSRCPPASKCRAQCQHRGASLMRKRPPLGPYSSPMTRALQWSSGGRGPYGRSTPVWIDTNRALSRENESYIKHKEELLSRNMEWSRGGLVFKAHRLWYHSTLGLRVKTRRASKHDAYARRIRV